MITSFHRSVRALAAGVLAVGLLTPAAEAQCPGPDKLDGGPCCGPATPFLPSFPPAQLPAMGIRFASCGLAGTQDLRISWTPPAQVACTEYITQLTVSDISGVPVLNGTMVMDYTRTWEETEPSGTPTQVWRFAVKVDISAIVGVPISPVILPNCVLPAGPFGTAYYYGYVDYENCDLTQPWEQTLVLYHACDTFIHRPALSNRPGTFHPGVSHALVAPHSPLQPFTPVASIAPGGPLVAEATRNIDTTSPPPTMCFQEDRVTGGSITPLGAGCICTVSSFPNQQTARQVTGATACIDPFGVPGSFASVDFFPALPWLHMVSTSIGTWGSPLAYPGVERAWVDEGIFALNDACTGQFAEFKYGGSTAGGWPVSAGAPAPSQNFLDLTDNYSAPLFGPYPGPFVGSVQPTNRLLYVNVP